MLDPSATIHGAWSGWQQVPQPALEAGVGSWHDLSHPLTESLSRSPAFPPPRFSKLESLPQDPVNVTEVQMAVHHGTHVDAPRHFFDDAPAFDQIPLDRLYGSGVVWQIDKGAGGLIDATDLAAARPRLEPGDILLLDTGWAQHINTPLYADHPSLTAAAAEWLLRQGIKMLGIDSSTPDLPAHRRREGFSWPVHQLLLGHGILIAEHLTNLTPLAGLRVEVMLCALSIVDSDGAPVRALARPLRQPATLPVK